uniref:ParB-like protein n=1 Tax=Siphoviridae sp. ct5co22 TaxID=2826294 RepID=A0A8S5QV95_9CAUD|nr:MAG TPA: ParB-like protein [Siphoviridae sp. ct5co22]
MTRELTIDPEFRDKIPPLSEDEFQKLEQNILEDGEVREPLVVWHNTIIDGHHRWKIIQKHNLTNYKVKQMDFPDKWAAIVWMCRNQLGRRNITDEQRTYLIGEAYRAQKMTQGTNNQYVQEKSEKPQNGVFQKDNRTAKIIAKEFGVGGSTVDRASQFVESLDAAETVSAGFKEAVLTGTVKAPKNVIQEIRNIPEAQRPAAVEAIKTGQVEMAKAIIRESKPEPPKKEAPPPPPFTAKQLGELVEAAGSSLDFALKQHLVLVHRDLLDSAEGRDEVKSALNDVMGIVQKYIEMIRRIEEIGEEN